jgi:hypothetical protein
MMCSGWGSITSTASSGDGRNPAGLQKWLGVVHRIQRFTETVGGRIGFALVAADLPDAGDGGVWKPDASFSVADAILDNPEFVSVLRAVLRDGHAIVPPAVQTDAG